MHLNSVDQKTSRELVATSMKEKLGNNPKLIESLVPNFALGCRRMTPGSDYLQSLTRDNVEVITDAATAFTEDGLLDGSGRETKADVIVCATGFAINKASYKIIGQNNRDLHEEWSELPKCYMSIMQDGFPNMFCAYLIPHMNTKRHKPVNFSK
jgi:cation diffusion facilitator CzcD-associated flavoprotein CzcO